jgi:hypothetical protein
MNHNRKISIVLFFVFAAVIGFGLGCGGGGSSSSIRTNLGGLAAKGPIAGASISVYALNGDGTTGQLLGSATTDSKGAYSVDIGSYTGNVLVEVTGGSYRDEATGEMETLTFPMRALLSNAASIVNVAVTPMTELAAQIAGTNPTTDAINRANAIVCSLVGVNIVNILPSDVTLSESGIVQSQIDYGLMLAALSQMAQDKNMSIQDVISAIADDIRDDSALTATGNDLSAALAEFLGNTNNKTGIYSPEQTGLANNLAYYTNNSLNPQGADVEDLWNAKQVIADLRDTILTIHNYKGAGVPGIIDTPLARFQNELNTVLIPELSGPLSRIGWVLGQLLSGITYGENTDGLSLQITPSPDGTRYDFVVLQDGIQVDTGYLSVSNPAFPTSGTIHAVMTTLTGQMTIDTSYQAAIDPSSLTVTSLELNGTVVAIASGDVAPVQILAFSGAMTINFTQGQPLFGDIYDNLLGLLPPELQNIQPNRVRFSGTLQTQTIKSSGSLDMPLVRNDAVITLSGIPAEDAQVETAIQTIFLPSSLTANGTFEEMRDGAATGAQFTGSTTGTFANAATFNPFETVSETNYPQWDISFNGSIQSPGRPVVTSFLRARQTAFNTILLDVSYRRTNPDMSEVFLSGNGSFDTTTFLLVAHLTNQNGINIDFTYNFSTADPDTALSGTITTTGGTQLGSLYIENGIAEVHFIDGLVEPVF